MELKRLDEANVGRVDLIPRAMFAISVPQFERQHALTFEKGIDDLDEYQALYLRGGKHTLALIHHSGDPQDGITLYLERGLSRKEADDLIAAVRALYDLREVWREDVKNLP
jgi:hypothetical protein